MTETAVDTETTVNLKRLLRPDDVRRVFGVTIRTVAGWEKAGLLKAYRLPNTKGKYQHRRYVVEDVITFAKQHGLPYQMIFDDDNTALQHEIETLKKRVKSLEEKVRRLQKK